MANSPQQDQGNPYLKGRSPNQHNPRPPIQDTFTISADEAGDAPDHHPIFRGNHGLFYLGIYRTVRNTGKSVTVPVRTVKGSRNLWHEMEVKPVDSNAVQFSRFPAAKPLSARQAPSNQEEFLTASIVRICSWCHRILDSDGNWHSFTDAMQRFHDLPDLLENTSHGMCPTCFQDYSQR